MQDWGVSYQSITILSVFSIFDTFPQNVINMKVAIVYQILKDSAILVSVSWIHFKSIFPNLEWFEARYMMSTWLHFRHCNDQTFDFLAAFVPHDGNLAAAVPEAAAPPVIVAAASRPLSAAAAAGGDLQYGPGQPLTRLGEVRSRHQGGKPLKKGHNPICGSGSALVVSKMHTIRGAGMIARTLSLSSVPVADQQNHALIIFTGRHFSNQTVSKGPKRAPNKLNCHPGARSPCPCWRRRRCSPA